jgi:hypothetical protein
MGFLDDESWYVATTPPQISAKQCMKRLKNKIFLHAYYNGNEMTAEEEERGCQQHLAHLKKNEKQRRTIVEQLGRRGNQRMCVWQWLRSARGRRWQLWRWRLYAALRDATTRSAQEEYVLDMAPNK